MSRQQNSRRVRNQPQDQIHVTNSFRFMGEKEGGNKNQKNPYAFLGGSHYRGDFHKKETKEGLRKNMQSNKELTKFFQESNTGDHIGRTVGSKELNMYQFKDPSQIKKMEHKPRPKYVETDPRRMKTTKFQTNPYKVGAVVNNNMFKKQNQPTNVQETKVMDKDYTRKVQNHNKNRVNADLIKMQNNVSHNLKGKPGNLGNRQAQSARQLPTFQHNRLW